MYHPEEKKNEKFIGNTEVIGKDLKELKTARLGKIAYDIHGKILPEKKYHLFPMFIGDNELFQYNKIRMDQLRAIKNGTA